jgi:hypothetical protein
MNLTQKISQMTPKGADLAATDLIEVSTLEAGSYVTKSITGQELIDAIPAPSGFVPTSRTLTINGTTQDLSADRTFTISTGLTVGTTPIASGTIGRVLFEGAGNVLQQSSSLFWDGTNNRLGIGTSSPSDTLSVNGNLTLLNLLGTNRSTQLTTSGSSDNLSSISFYPATGTNVCQSFDIMPRGTGQANQKSQFAIWGTDFIANQTNYELLLTRATGVSYTFESFRGGTGVHRPLLFSAGASNQLWAYTSGNVGIGTTTDAGFRLDVNGTARVTNLNVNLSTGSIPFMGASGLVTQNNANLFWDNTNARLGIGTATPLDRLHILTNGNNIVRFSSNAANANIISFRDIDGTGQGGFLATGSTFSYGTYRSAQTNLSGGIGGIGLRTGNGANAHISFYSGNADSDLSTERLRLVASTGNVLINTTTDAGFRLDVNGTARVSDNLLLTNGIIATSTATTRLQGSLNYFTHNRIASSGIHGFQISNYGSTTSFWRYDAGTGDIEFGNSTAYGVTFFANNLARTKMWSSGQWTMGSATAYNASALVAMESTTTGFLPPRMTTTQKNAIATPATGLQVYDTTLNRPCFYDGTTWITL